jgi:hypothetical protein
MAITSSTINTIAIKVATRRLASRTAKNRTTRKSVGLIKKPAQRPATAGLFYILVAAKILSETFNFIPSAIQTGGTSMSKVHRRTVDLSAYPDLVVIYLGMRVNIWAGLKTLIGLGPKITSAVQAAPDGLLRHEDLVYSLFPPHIGMRRF